MKRAIFFLLIAGLCALFVQAAEDKTGKLVRVENKKVCMVNDRSFEKDQIAVDVQGKTYYGCCEMCKKALQEREDLRSSTDPVSGKKVDKATAIIGADENNVVYYFESEENMNNYQPPSSSENE